MKVINKKDSVILKPDGDIIASNVNELRDIILSQLQNNKIDIVIDLKHVATIDAIGLGVMISCYKSLQELKGTLSLVSVNEDLMTLFSCLRLDKYFSICQNLKG